MDTAKKSKATIVLGVLLWSVIAYLGFRIILSFFSPEIPETEIESLTKSLTQECIREANVRGYALDVLETRQDGDIIGQAIKSGIRTNFSCKKLAEDGSKSLTGGKLDLRIQTQ